jgi:hypothetical protein
VQGQTGALDAEERVGHPWSSFTLLLPDGREGSHAVNCRSLSEEICAYMGMTQEEANAIFATLRHIELLKSHREGTGDDTRIYVDIWS